MMLPDMDKQKLVALIQAEYEFAERTLAMLTPQQMETEKVQVDWTTKVVVAHLSAWMRRLVTWFEEARQGKNPAIPDHGYTWDEMDDLNDKTAVIDKDRALDEVLSEFRQQHQAVIAMISQLSEAELFEHDWNGLFSEPPWQLIPGNTYDHFPEHIGAVRAHFFQQNRQNLS